MLTRFLDTEIPSRAGQADAIGGTQAIRITRSTARSGPKPGRTHLDHKGRTVDVELLAAGRGKACCWGPHREARGSAHEGQEERRGRGARGLGGEWVFLKPGQSAQNSLATRRGRARGSPSPAKDDAAGFVFKRGFSDTARFGLRPTQLRDATAALRIGGRESCGVGRGTPTCHWVHDTRDRALGRRPGPLRTCR
jgi:hypothetical protein